MAILIRHKYIRHSKYRVNYSHYIQSMRHLSIAHYCLSSDMDKKKDKSPSLTLHVLHVVSWQVWGLQGVSAEWQGSCREGWKPLHGPSMQFHSQHHLEACGHSTGKQIWLLALTYWPMRQVSIGHAKSQASNLSWSSILPLHPLMGIPRRVHVRANEHSHTYVLVMVDNYSVLCTVMHPVNNYLRVHLKWLFSPKYPDIFRNFEKCHITYNYT